MSAPVQMSLRTSNHGNKSSSVVLKEGPILKYGNRFGKIKRIEQRWMKMTNVELSFSLSRGKSSITAIPISSIVFVYTKDSLPKSTNKTNQIDLEGHHISVGPPVEFLKSDITDEDFVVCTSSKPRQRAKHYVFKALTIRLRDEWVDAIGSLLTASRHRVKDAPVHKFTFVHRIRNRLRLITFADDFQALIGLMVIDSSLHRRTIAS